LGWFIEPNILWSAFEKSWNYRRRAESDMLKIKCEGCGRRAPSFEVVDYGSMDTGYKQLCRRCFNMKAATAAGLDETIRVNLARESLTGIFRGIDDEGRLILEAGGTKRCIEAGDVWLGGSTSESGSEGEADARD